MNVLTFIGGAFFGGIGMLLLVTWIGSGFAAPNRR